MNSPEGDRSHLLTGKHGWSLALCRFGFCVKFVYHNTKASYDRFVSLIILTADMICKFKCTWKGAFAVTFDNIRFFLLFESCCND